MSGNSNRKSYYSSRGPPACAACKNQRRKCTPDCKLAPYFPAEAERDFLNAHRLFGANNIVKTLNKIEDGDLKNAAVQSMVYEANARFRDPLGGCLAIILQLKTQIQNLEMQLEILRNQIAIHEFARSTGNTLPIYYTGYGVSHQVNQVKVEQLNHEMVGPEQDGENQQGKELGVGNQENKKQS